MARNAASLKRAARSVKSKADRLIGPAAIHQACSEIGYEWRQCLLDPVRTVGLFVTQILHGNIACSHVRLQADVPFTAAGYCAARKRLPLELFSTMLRRSAQQLHDGTSDSTWFGHRVAIIDGSSFSMPHTKALDEYFGHPTGQKRGCSFPIGQVTWICDVKTGAVRDVLHGPVYTGEMSHGYELHRRLNKGDVVVADRAYGSWGFVVAARGAGVHPVVRAHQSLKISFKEQDHRQRPTWRRIARLGSLDMLMEWNKPERPKWMTREQYDSYPATIVVRVIERRKGTTTVRLITTLTDAKAYPAKEIAALYAKRWTIETAIGHIKTTMKMSALKCKTVDGVLKELYVFALAYNQVCIVRAQIARLRNHEPDELSFVDTLRWLNKLRAGKLPPIGIEIGRLRRRPGRREPRVIKRRPKQYSLMTSPRASYAKGFR